MPDTLIPLSRTPLNLASRGYAPAPTYWAVYKAAIDARIPTVERDGKLLVRECDLPTVAAHFGLTPAQQSAA